MKKHNHILFKLSSKVLIAAIVLCVLFGSGTHVHTVFHHFSDHGDIHIYVHSHHADTHQDHTSGFDEKDDHQHPTATVELEGTFIQKKVSKVFTDYNLSIEGVISSVHGITEVNPVFLDLPPPEPLQLSEYFYPIYLRGPPLG